MSYVDRCGNTVRTPKYHLMNRDDSLYWYVWFYGKDGKQKQRNLKIKKSEFTRDEMREKLRNDESVGGLNIRTLEWFRDTILARLKDESLGQDTYKLYVAVFNHFIVRFGETLLVDEIDTDNVFEFEEYLRKCGCKNVSINAYMGVLKASMNRLITRGIIATNTFKKFKMLRKSKNGDKREYLKKEEYESLLKLLDENIAEPKKSQHEKYLRFLRILAYTGRRPSEIRALNRDDVFLNGDGSYFVVTIKKKRGERMVKKTPLNNGNGKLVEDFQYFLNEYESSKPFAFCSKNNLILYLSRVLSRIGYKDITAKSLRHSFITRGIENGIPVRQMQRYIGHTSIATTEIYSHDSYGGEIPDLGF